MEMTREARALALSWGTVGTERRPGTEWPGPPVLGHPVAGGKDR